MARRKSDYTALVTAKVNRYGQDLTVERRPAGAGQMPTTQTIRFIAAPDGTAQATISGQGSANTFDPNPTIFVCAPGSDVQELIDKVWYQGYKYKISRVNDLPLGGGCYAYGVRVEKMS